MALYFSLRGLVDLVVVVLARQDAVGGDDDRFEVVDFLELVGLGVGRAGHAGELALQRRK